MRWTCVCALKWWRWQYYFVLLAGRNRRVLTDRERRIQRLAMAAALAVFLLFSALLGILVLYLVESAAGIDLIPGFSFGVWGQVFSRRFCGSCRRAGVWHRRAQMHAMWLGVSGVGGVRCYYLRSCQRPSNKDLGPICV